MQGGPSAVLLVRAGPRSSPPPLGTMSIEVGRRLELQESSVVKPTRICLSLFAFGRLAGEGLPYSFPALTHLHKRALDFSSERSGLCLKITFVNAVHWDLTFSPK